MIWSSSAAPKKKNRFVKKGVSQPKFILVNAHAPMVNEESSFSVSYANVTMGTDGSTIERHPIKVGIPKKIHARQPFNNFKLDESIIPMQFQNFDITPREMKLNSPVLLQAPCMEDSKIKVKPNINLKRTQYVSSERMADSIKKDVLRRRSRHMSSFSVKDISHNAEQKAIQTIRMQNSKQVNIGKILPKDIELKRVQLVEMGNAANTRPIFVNDSDDYYSQIDNVYMQYLNKKYQY